MSVIERGAGTSAFWYVVGAGALLLGLAYVGSRVKKAASETADAVVEKAKDMGIITDEMRCQKAIAENDAYNASLYCDAATFLRWQLTGNADPKLPDVNSPPFSTPPFNPDLGDYSAYEGGKGTLFDWSAIK